jgi:serine protease AprX
VSLDAGVRVLASSPARDTWAPRQRGPGTHGANQSTSRGGMAVAIIDSGIAPHADLPLSRIRAYKDFVTGGTTPVDNCGHGTHVAGIVAGSGARSNGAYAGIVPDVDIVALRVLGDDCSGNTSDVIDALEWIARHHETYNIKVVNISLGHAVFESIFTDPLVQAVERLSRKGVAVITAAGNKGINPATGNPGYGGVGVPCNAPSAICVGSLDTNGSPELTDDRVSDSSSRGPSRFNLLAKPDLVAPGVNIVSLAAPGSRLFNEFERLQVPGSTGQSDYFTLSGTSMASPAVAGAAVLLLRENHQLAANTLKVALQFTARVLPQTDVLTQGAGALNITGALTLADAINPNVPRGQNWIRHQLTASNTDAAGNVVSWGRRIIYGDRFVRPEYAEVHMFRWDDAIVWAYDAIADDIVWDHATDDNIVWGNDDNIVWGNTADDNIVWGNDESDNIVWGIDDNIVWGNDDNIVWGNSDDDNIVWGNSHLREVWASNVVWGFWDDNIVWGNITRDSDDNIVWGNDDDNIVWGNCSTANDNIVWGNGDNIVWGNDDNIVWGNCKDNIVWGNDDDNIVWGNAVLTGGRHKMEKMPYQAELERAATLATPSNVTTSDWRNSLPVLAGEQILLRELRVEDAPSLLAMLTTEEVSRFISPPPTTVEGFERFIAWTHHERAQGNYICYGVVPAGMTTAVGLFQLRSLEPGFGSCEWGFALGSQFWGTGMFASGARAILNFGVDVLGAQRFEARAAVANGRGNGALRKIGAVQEGVLRRSFLRNGQYHDQVLWSILAEDWRLQRIEPDGAVVH